MNKQNDLQWLNEISRLIMSRIIITDDNVAIVFREIKESKAVRLESKEIVKLDDGQVIKKDPFLVDLNKFNKDIG